MSRKFHCVKTVRIGSSSSPIFPCFCNGCHDLMHKAMSFSDLANVYVYIINFWYMSKYDAINIMNNSNLVNKKVFL